MPGFYTLIETRFIKQNKKTEHPFADIGKLESCAKFQHKIWNSMVVDARQNFPERKTGFLEVIELCLNLFDGFALN